MAQILSSKYWECPSCKHEIEQIFNVSKEEEPKFRLLMENLDYFLTIIPDESILKQIDIQKIAKIASDEFKDLVKLRDEDKSISDLRSENKDLNKKYSNATSEIKEISSELKVLKAKSYYKGVEQEIDLAKSLQAVSMGTLDVIIPNDVSNNEDILIEVRNDSSALLGKIVIESKNVKNWSRSFLSQIKKEIRKANATFGVIATTQFPKNSISNTILLMEGIWVCKPEYTSVVYRAIRQLISESSNKGMKENELRMLIESEQFVDRLTKIIQLASDVRKQKNSTMKQLTKALSRFDTLAGEVEEEAGAILTNLNEINGENQNA